LRVHPARNEQDFLVFDVHAFDRADARGEIEHLRFENGGVVNQPRSRSQMTGGLRHSSMVVQIENDGAKIGSPSGPVTTRFEPSRTPASSMSPKS
jgi:hypothetical protein